MSAAKQSWYIVKQSDDTCKVITSDLLPKNPTQKQWGEFVSEQEAIAKKIGLIRAGQCKPL